MGKGSVLLSRIFIHGTDKVEGGLIVLFVGLVFSVDPPSEIFLPTTLCVLQFCVAALHFLKFKREQGVASFTFERYPNMNKTF